MNRWDERYSKQEHVDAIPAPLLIHAVEVEPVGRALDLACGPGRNSLYLAGLGWQVTAVDYSKVAIGMLRGRDPRIDARVADLEAGGFSIAPHSYDLICDLFYLQRNLFSEIRIGVRKGGLFVGAIHLPGERRNPSYVLQPGELRSVFADWKILHYGETDHAEIITRKPQS
ncbi:MAG: methyltransferase domain-containing protein [Bryobacteraceae bacterium]